MPTLVPTEAQEQRAVVQYLSIRKIKHFRVPNETYTTSRRQKGINKMLGVVPGVPDLFVIAGNQLIAIEMKRRKGSSTSQYQKDWIAVLNQAGIPAQICRGADEAIEFIEKYQPRKTKSLDDSVF